MKKQVKFIKVTSLVILMTLLVTLVAACGSTNSTAPSTSSNPVNSPSSSAAASSSAPAADVIVFKAGHVLAADHPYQLGLIKMNELLQEKTNGRIKLELFPGSQLGGERELCEGVQMGTADIGLVTAPLANFDKDWFLFDLPYLFDSKKEAYAFMDGEGGQAMLDGLEANSIKGVTFFETGFFNIFNNQKPLVKPEDCKGLNIRTMENQAYMTYFKTLGANPIPMAYGEVFTALQNNTINGSLIPIASIYTSKFYQVAKYISRTQNWYCPTTMIMSMDAWNKIPDDLKPVFIECAQGGRDYMRQLLTDNEDKQIEDMKKQGAEVIEVDKELWKSSPSVKAVYDLLVPKFVSQELVDKAKAAAASVK